jgi:uncharacterized glyoxalase superfamily protein PhnB
MQVSRGNLVLHLSEHSRDCSPGAETFVHTDDPEGLHREIMSCGYRFPCPEFMTAPWGDRIFEVTDPFSKRLLFNERKSSLSL